jgi:hypothetical protein
LLDKDDILEQLFESKGIGDAAWRRRLSRESDIVLKGKPKRPGDRADILLACSGNAPEFWHPDGLVREVVESRRQRPLCVPAGDSREEVP